MGKCINVSCHPNTDKMRHMVKATFVLMVIQTSSSVPLTLREKNDEALKLPDSEPKIAGGAEATSNAFPYQVAIIAKGTATLRCGGALIAENYVLTSAYCAKLGSASDIQVMVGNPKLSTESPSQIVDVELILAHEEYDTDGRKNDVAILQLNKSQIITKPSVEVIPVKSTAVAIGTKCIFTGWGSDTWNGAATDILEKVNLSIVGKIDCMLQLHQVLREGQICAAGVQEDNACFLDEGGPLVCDGELTGILSHSVNCGKQNKSSVYTEVANYKTWINRVVFGADTGAATANSLSCFTVLAMLSALTSFWNSRT